AQKALFWGQLGFTLWGDLTDEDVARANIGTDADDAAVIQVTKNIFGHVWNLTGDLFCTQLGIASVNLVLFDVDRGQDILFHNALAQDNCVLVIVAFPWHKCHEQVTAQGHFAVVGTRTISQNLASLNAVAHVDQRRLVVVGALVGALKLAQHVGIANAFIIHDGDEISVHVFYNARLWSDDHIASIVCSTQLHTGTNIRCLGTNQWNSLLLHVRTHQRTVSIVVLQERNHRGTNGDHLTRRNVNEVNTISVSHANIAVLEANLNAVINDVALGVLLNFSLTNGVTVFFISGEVVNLIGDATIFYLAVRGFNEAESINASVGSQRTDQTNVRAFGSLNRAHAAVVRWVNVAD